MRKDFFEINLVITYIIEFYLNIVSSEKIHSKNKEIICIIGFSLLSDQDQNNY